MIHRCKDWMRGLLLIASKEFRHFSHDPYTLALTVAVPLVQLLLFGYALETRVRDLPIAVQNLDRERFGKALVDQFVRSSIFRVARYADSEDELRRMLRRGEVRAALQIPSGYSVDAFYRRPVPVRLWVDGSDAAMAGQAVIAAESAALEHTIAIALTGSRTGTLPIEMKPEILYNPSGRSVNFFVPGLVAVLLEMTTMLLVALSFVKERERGTLDQLRITNLTLGQLIGGKLAACTVTGLGTGIVLTILMRTVFGIPIRGSLWSFALALITFVPPILGLGLMVTAEARNQAQALQLSFLVGLPSILLSGFIFPRDSMPPAMYALSTLVPTTWSLNITRGIVLRGAGIADLAPSFCAAFALSALYLTIGAWHLRRRLL